MSLSLSEIDSCFLKNILSNPCLQPIIFFVWFLLNAYESSAAPPIVDKSISFWQRVNCGVFLFLVLAIHNLYFFGEHLILKYTVTFFTYKLY